MSQNNILTNDIYPLRILALVNVRKIFLRKANSFFFFFCIILVIKGKKNQNKILSRRNSKKEKEKLIIKRFKNFRNTIMQVYYYVFNFK